MSDEFSPAVRKAEKKFHQRRAFNKWFSGLLLEQPSCLIRDVLRDSKETLWEHWLEREPVEVPARPEGEKK